MSVSLLGPISLGSQTLAGAGDNATPGAKTPDSPPRLLGLYARLPMSFELNAGQADRRVKFVARGQGSTLFLTSDEAVLVLQAEGAARPGSNRAPSPSTIRLKRLGANPAIAVRGEDILPGESKYFLGKDPRRWLTHLPTYARVRYPDVHPGVDLVYFGPQGQLECDFVVAPGADPNRIAWGLEGAERRRVDRVIVTPSNGFSQQVQLGCSNLPPGASCIFSNATASPNGSPASVTLAVNTIKQVKTPAPRWTPPARWRLPLVLLTLLTGILWSLAYRRTGFGARRVILFGRLSTWSRLAFLGLALALVTLAGSCRDANTAATGGTTTGNYTITITGTLGSNSAVARSTTVNLSVT